MISMSPFVLWIRCRRYRLIVMLFLEHRVDNALKTLRNIP